LPPAVSMLAAAVAVVSAVMSRPARISLVILFWLAI